MEFRIFKPKFTWTLTNIINAILFALVLLILFSLNVYRIHVEAYLMIVILIGFLVGSFFKWNGWNNIQQLKGEIIGRFVLKNDEILIEQNSSTRIIKIEDIKSIEIIASDREGTRSFSYSIELNYENGLSNGTRNFLKIELKNNEKIKLQFQLKYGDKFQKIRPIIEEYYKLGIISYLNSIDILEITKKSEYEEFKKLKNL